MHSDERRKAIADVLHAADAPVSASALAEKFSVSRQIIVGDIALLRSSGEEILATPRGYVTPKEARGIVRRVAVKHMPQEMEAELNAIVDNGCTVIDVIVDTPSTASSPARCKFRTATRSASSLSAAKRRSRCPVSPTASTCTRSPVPTRRRSSARRVRCAHCASCWRKTEIKG